MTTPIHLDVGGIAITVRAATSSYLDCVVGRLGSRSAADDPEIFLTIGPNHPETGRQLDDVAEELDEATIAHRDGRFELAVADDSLAVVEDRRIAIVGPDDTPRRRKNLDNLVQFAVAAAVAGPDRMLAHGAVLARGTDAAVVVGRSGRGKSTLAVAGLLDGWKLLADDLAVVRPTTGWVTGVARAPMIPTAVARAVDLSSRPTGDQRGRHELAVELLSPDPHRLLGFIIVDHDDGPGRSELVDDHLEVFDPALAVPPAHAVVQRHLAATAALIGYPVARLYHSSSEGERIDRAQQLLPEAFTLLTEAA